jgi:hypothetical protein
MAACSRWSSAANTTGANHPSFASQRDARKTPGLASFQDAFSITDATGDGASLITGYKLKSLSG